MKKNKGIIAVLIVLVVAAAAVFGYYKYSATKPAEVSESVSVSETQSEEKTTRNTTVPTTAEPTTEEPTTEEATVSKEDYEAVKTGVWYLYNEKEKTAYAFEFTGKDRVEIAYFDDNNTAGLDAKYFTTSEDYEIKNLEGDIVIELEDPINDNESFMFTLQKGKVCYGRAKLDNEDEVSLDIVFNHFND